MAISSRYGKAPKRECSFLRNLRVTVCRFIAARFFWIETFNAAMSFGLSFLDEVVAFVIQLAVKFSLNVRILRMLFWNFFRI